MGLGLWVDDFRPPAVFGPNPWTPFRNKWAPTGCEAGCADSRAGPLLRWERNQNMC